jgi:hypothetical protein
MQLKTRGIGSRKHGRCGISGPSPKSKFMTAFDANRLADQDKAKRKPPIMFASVREALKTALK